MYTPSGKNERKLCYNYYIDHLFEFRIRSVAVQLALYALVVTASSCRKQTAVAPLVV